MAKQGDGGGTKGEDRIFVRDGFRSFRRTYRVREVYWGAGTGAVLIGIVGWVGWKGVHPDPTLFDMSAALSGNASAGAPPVDAPRRASERLGAPRAPATESGASAEQRGPLPAGLGAGAFQEGKVGHYSADDMYIKINGRAGYFQSFGARSLTTIALEGPAAGGAPSSVDIELYDLGESRNAIGAYNGERPPGVEATVADGSTYHFDRNAAFLARGPYYARFIGSDESAPVVAEVRRLLELFRREIQGEALPWGFALFVDALKYPASAVTYVKSNAFSFGFARDVYKVSLSPADSQEDMEAFVVAAADAAAALEQAGRYAEGFGSLGAAAGQTPAKVKLFKDEYLATYSGATAYERWVFGVRGAPGVSRAAEVLEQVRAGLAGLPEAVRARAVPSADLDAPAGGDYGAAPAPDPAPLPASEPAPAAGAPGAERSSEPDEAEATGAGKPGEEGSDEY
ncbi:MAG TPA: DUF6599 family protein [Polyangiaceae bacterium]|nr:DUF6599 family protein [Polyangiaceae bacterium]